MDLAFALLFVSLAPFFCRDCHLLLPAAAACSGPGTCSMGHQQRGGELSSEKLWVLSGTRDGSLVRSPGVAVCSGWDFALPACLPAGGGGSSVLYHSCFPLPGSQVFCLFFIVPFMCFPSLQKSLALFKIDLEWLPRLYPERERERKTHGRQVPIELSKAFTPHQDLWIYQKPGLLRKSSA